MKNLLFITWDGPQTSYMEGLFMPIFQEIAKRGDYKFHVVQFTWADDKKIAHTKAAADKMGITYTAWPVLRKPNVSIGSLLTVLSSAGKIKKYIRENNIHIVMPRSTFPAMIVNQINSSFASRVFFPFRGLRGAGFFPIRGLRGASFFPFRGLRGKLIFDADGLPIEERIDFAGLKKESFQYKLMKSAETKMLYSADAVITRSEKAIEIHLENVGDRFRQKFSVVSNGRNKSNFKFCKESRVAIRKEFGVAEKDILFIYVGSLGGKYALKEMFQIFENISATAPSKFLILTGDEDYVRNYARPDNRNIFINRVDGTEVYKYLSAADIGFALIYPSYSMQAAVPTKLGEYLLCGLPVIASKGIGDTEKILENFEECYLYDHSIGLLPQIAHLKNFIEKAIFASRNNIAEKAQDYFSLEAAAESYLKAIKN